MGKWIKASEMNEHANIYGRQFKTNAGRVWTYYPGVIGMLPDGEVVSEWWSDRGPSEEIKRDT